MFRYVLLIIMLLSAVVAAEVWLPWTYEGSVVIIPQGASAKQVCRQLKEDGHVRSYWLCIGLMRITHASQHIQAGRWEIPENASLWQTFDHLMNKPPQMINVQLIEGTPIRQLIASISNQPGLVLSKELKQEMLDHRALYEGQYYPDTYRVAYGANLREVLSIAQKRMAQELKQLWSNRASDLLISTPEQALIIASLIEEETGYDEEKKLISSVIYNRLKQRMPLQIDATVHYALNQYQPLSRKDLKVDHPYNTYRISGLPPSPIALVQPSSIVAALHPEKTDYLFYVANPKTGRHIFTTQYKDHLSTIKKLRKSS